MRNIKKLFKIICGLVACAAFAALGFVLYAGKMVETKRNTHFDVPAPDLTPFAAEVDLELGKRIAHVRSGCVDCHGQDLGGKTVIDDPAMGRLEASNLTPYNLASWTDGEIALAIRNGIGKSSRPLALMPSTDYNGLSGGDLASLIAYLRSLPSIERQTKGVSFGPLAKVLITTGQLPTMFSAELIDHHRPFSAKPTEAVTAAFGAYLAQACTGCHNQEFSGGPIPGAPPDWAPASDITPTGIGTWSENDFITTMRSGVNPSGYKLKPPFPVAFTSQMSDIELKALWEFFKTVEPSKRKEGLSAKVPANR